MSDRETASYVVGHVHAATWLSNHNSMLRSLCTEPRLWATGQRHGTGMCAAFSPLVSALGVASSSQVAEGYRQCPLLATTPHRHRHCHRAISTEPYIVRC